MARKIHDQQKTQTRKPCFLKWKREKNKKIHDLSTSCAVRENNPIEGAREKKEKQQIRKKRKNRQKKM